MFRLLVTCSCLLFFAIQPNRTEAAIGDDTLDGTEQCDDGNQTPGDGCDATGQVEPGYICVNGGSFCCPNTHSEDGRDFYHCALFTGQAAASLHCEDVGGALARITSSTINVGATPPAADATWIDGTDAATEGDWRYADGTVATYFNWAGTEPNGSTAENCLHLLDDGLFYDVDCAITLSFLCELRMAGQCGDGTTDEGEACDDGNVSNHDACLNSCIDAICGDGFERRGVEECDDGNAVSDDACRSDCTKNDNAPAPRASEPKQSGGCSHSGTRHGTFPTLTLVLLILALFRRSTHNRSA